MRFSFRIGNSQCDDCKRQIAQVNQENNRAKKKGLPNTLTLEQWLIALDYFSNSCAICGETPTHFWPRDTLSPDHWIPLSRLKKNNPGTIVTNIVPLCCHCNLSKSTNNAKTWLIRKLGTQEAQQIILKIEEYFELVFEPREPLA